MKLSRRGVILWPLGILIVSLAVVVVADHGPGSSSVAYRQINLVSDLEGVAWFTDPNLVNPWGIAITPSGRIWISDNGTGLSTVYSPSGTVASLVVTIAPPAGSTNPAAPTGMAFNPSTSFVVTEGTNSGPALFIWATEDGTVSGWNPAVDPANSILMIDNSASGAVYKGIARAVDAASNELIFVTNFNAGQVEKYDANFNFVAAFTDTNLPAGYAPFGIQEAGGNLYVTFALQDSDKHDDVGGPGNGYVDVFDLNGNLVRRFASQGSLNSPWGIAFAPSGFGQFSHAVLIGNFGDGRINAFDASGAFLGALTDERGNPFTIGGLWGLSFLTPPSAVSKPMAHRANSHRHHHGQSDGSDDEDNNQVRPDLYFTAGLNHEADGLFGVIKTVPIEDDND